MLYRWLYEGVLEDPFSEFFIAEKKDFYSDAWHGKYILDDSMLPSCISRAVANKVRSYLSYYVYIRLGVNDDDLIQATNTALAQSTNKILNIE
jgi:gamma-tubulin complex component 3